MGSPAAVWGLTSAPSEAAAMNIVRSVHWRLTIVDPLGRRAMPSRPRVPAPHHSRASRGVTSGHSVAPLPRNTRAPT